ncbi:MAG: hypothetical protein IJ544_00375 [Prevotella sp.]|nr:hypothetical protein [Prevotella sp.]
MSQQKLTKTDIAIIVLIFVLYMIGYAWLIEPKKETAKTTKRTTLLQREPTKKADKQQPKSLSVDWPLDLGKYFYTIDIDPGYEMEDEEWVEVEKVGDRYYAKRENDWPDISGHFEWYCNEKLTTTQQMFDYVVAHRHAIIKQMQEVRRRGLNNPMDEASYYQDHYDEYQDDPEDELRFPPEIFDANDD